MSFVDWVSESADRIRSDGLSGVRDSAYHFYIGALGKFDWLHPGTPIYEREWDVLVILDATRFDLMAEVADEYDYLGDLDAFSSVGSTSAEWLEKNFGPEYADEMANTAHVTANIYTEELLDPDDFAVLDEVWRYRWNDELGTIYPRDVTDRAIYHGRHTDAERLIVHYMQPHYPFIPHPDLAPGMRAGESEKSVWQQLREGLVERSVVWDAYRANLQYVLDELPLLLDNVDAERVIVSADHGNALGELGVYGHPYGVPLSCLREVPWIETTATDTGEYEPRSDTKDDETSVEEKLAALGYV